MQDHDWNDLKYLLALYRHGSFAKASTVCRVNETTIARRLKSLSGALGHELFQRNAAGQYTPTEAGAKIIAHAQSIERQNGEIREILAQVTNEVSDTVRISSVPFVINRVLIPQLYQFYDLNPGITLELTPNSRNLDLSKREADIALRMARPRSGGLRTSARALGRLEFSVFCARNLNHRQRANLRWITYDDENASLPHAEWLDKVARQDRNQVSPLRIADLESAIEATVSGLGKTLLPIIYGDEDPRLRSLDVNDAQALCPHREVWLLSHKDQQHRKAVSIVKHWLTQLSWR